MSRRVVITGLGCVTPVGTGAKSAWESVREGRSGVGPIRQFDASGFPTTFAAEVPSFNLSDWVSPDVVRSLDRSGLNVQFGLAAAVQAVQDSGLDVAAIPDRTRFGVYLGSGEGNQDFDVFMGLVADNGNAGDPWNMDLFTAQALQRMHYDAERFLEPNVLSGRVAGMFGAEGPCANTLTACAASAQAIGEGSDFIRTGLADIMIVGGAHSMIHPYGITGFSLLTALSRRNDNPQAASRPFDNERDGFVIAEGGAMLVIEEYEHARKRGAKIYGEILGYGVACDAYRITDIPPDGNGMTRAIGMALKNANMNIDDISYINAHGTSTDANDRTETLAVKGAFGEQAYKIPMSSTKSMTGHLVAACGALEAIFCVNALAENTVPPTINHEHPDPDCDLDYIPNVARAVSLNAVMSNNSGFGGQNVSLIFT
ncbi:MAG TPA: beta-ketoacyl-[acyl-carrier-protein] synthase II, partial [Planctomicrobium sp.]|nr:beta-ketoacyl-[acyl-carrier-protein] synthase II [Planctomicrobium sp.]